MRTYGQIRQALEAFLASTCGAAVGPIITLRKELAGQGRDAGPDTICWHLRHRHQLTHILHIHGVTAGGGRGDRR